MLVMISAVEVTVPCGNDEFQNEFCVLFWLNISKKSVLVLSDYSHIRFSYKDWHYRNNYVIPQTIISNKKIVPVMMGFGKDILELEVKYRIFLCMKQIKDCLTD